MKHPHSTTLKQASRDFFNEQALPETSLQALEKKLQRADVLASKTPHKKPRSYTKPTAIAASVTMAALMGILWATLSPPQMAEQTSATTALHTQKTAQQAPSQSEVIAAIASEVTKNHIKFKPLEVSSQDFNTVRDYFTQLDFSPQASRHFQQLASRTQRLAGGRYCSIQSETAAQLRYHSDQGQWSTLYQSQYNAATFGALPQVALGQPPIETFSRGLKVSVWVERQLLMVSVEDAP